MRLAVLGGKGRHASAAQSSDSLVIYAGAADDPVPYYAAADVFVLPTFYDPVQPSSDTEAAAGGLAQA